ncbi:sensor histidine kinase [Aquipuribacter hungaricus]|uniref:histidine kinase n=1 Tax=Aquipuribacter hungaricus TaxID=545624 RepID=A0ABV7WKD8_9MICO
MRERLLAAFVLLTLLTVTLYGVPRALVRAGVVTQQAQQEVDRDAGYAAGVVTARLEAGLPVTVPDLSVVTDDLDPEDQLLYLPQGADPVVLSGPSVAAEGRRDALTARVELPGGGAVEARRAVATVRQDVVRELQPIVLTGAASLVVAVLTAVVLSRRLARPFQELAAQATVLGGDAGAVELPPQPVREAEAIAAALRASSSRLTAILRRERQFARNASHQLRTPLTGIRLRVEDLSAWPETHATVREELDAVLAEVDRLDDTVTALLSFAREEGLGQTDPVQLRRVVFSVVQRWAVVAASSGRTVTADVPADASVHLPTSAVDQVLDVLVHNALVHGRGAVVLSGAHDGACVDLVVRDEGTLDLDDELVFARRRSGSAAAGEGIGLALAAEFAQVLGGRLEVLDRAPTTFRLRLPSALGALP